MFGKDNHPYDASAAEAAPDPGPTVWTMGDAYREGLLGYPPADPAEPMQAEFLNAAQLKMHGDRLGYVAVDHG